jgi:hypothetical protein
MIRAIRGKNFCKKQKWTDGSTAIRKEELLAGKWESGVKPTACPVNPAVLSKILRRRSAALCGCCQKKSWRAWVEGADYGCD